MRVLGVDPGIRNLGLCLCGDGPTIKKTLVTRKIPYERALELLLGEVKEWINRTDVDVVAVEEVVWRRRRGMLPLAHIAGALVGMALSAGKPVYLLTPAQKRNGPALERWTEHEWDARNLARVAYHAERAPSAATASIRRRRLVLFVAGCAPSKASKNGKAGKR